MKKLCISALALWITISSAFAAYQPSPAEQSKVDAAGSVLLQIVETKHDGNYELLLWILKSFESKVASSERKTWILETLISLTMDKMWMMMMKDDMVDDTHTDTMMKDEMIAALVPLENVTEWKTIRGVVFNDTETWSASNSTTETGNHVYAMFEYLPDAWPDNFYEGWIVRMSGWLSVLSTGELIMKDGVYVNDWSTIDNIDDHTFYVLTLEPRDNDPAPADHVLEAHVR